MWCKIFNTVNFLTVKKITAEYNYTLDTLKYFER